MRKLLSVKSIQNISPIENADFLEVVEIGGWKCVVKKGDFEIGEKVHYFEIDSLIDSTDKRFKFLKKTTTNDGNVGYRIKTIKLRGQISQGLVYKFMKNPPKVWKYDSEKSTVSKSQNLQTPKIRKLYQWPKWIKKTDEERLQNLNHYFKIHSELKVDVTHKRDGSSLTIFYNPNRKLRCFDRIFTFFNRIDYKSGVCSRNMNLPKNYSNNFWEVVIREHLIEKIKQICHENKEYKNGLAIQGELTHPDIQKNFEQVKKGEFHCFRIMDKETGRYLTTSTCRDICNRYEINHVKLFLESCKLFQLCSKLEDVQILIDSCEKKYGQKIEGLVFNSVNFDKDNISFKLVSNNYLLSEDLEEI